MFLTPEREVLFKRVVAQTQFDITILLENVHDPHNIGAVLRSCDAVGVREIYILDTAPELIHRNFGKMNSSTGVKKWIKINRYKNLEECVTDIKSKYHQLIGTHLSAESKSLYNYDYTGSLALVFGNEHKGISDDLLAACDQNMIIPQMGMVQSLNISVACAVTLFEVARQRISKGLYSSEFNPESQEQSKLLEHYANIHLDRS